MLRVLWFPVWFICLVRALTVKVRFECSLKTELQLMSIRTLKKYIMQSWNKYGKNSAHISSKSKVRNGKLWFNTRYVHLFSISMCYIIIIIIIFIYVYVSIQTNTVDFIFKYIKEKNPLSFHNFSNLSRECYEDREFWPWNSWIIHISPTTDTDNVLKTVLRVYNTFFTMFFNSQNTSINQSLWSNFQPFW